MPELPEVETVRRGLMGYILGGKITGIQVLCEKSFKGKPVVGRVMEIRRFGKALVIDLDNDYSLMIHLRMTGQLIWRDKGKNRGESGGEHGGKDEYGQFPGFAGGHPSENFVAELPNKQTRVIIEFENGTLFFNDQRKFGFVKAIATGEVEGEEFIRKLAKEPWQMTGKDLYEKLQRRKNSVIKATILDQTVMSGLGNIYADEALFEAKIHPARKSGSLSRAEVERLLEAARMVMSKSIELGGSTIRNYVKADGTRGDYLELFAKVYHREGKPCNRCGTEIKKIKLAGRGTHFCPKCQKENG